MRQHHPKDARFRHDAQELYVIADTLAAPIPELWMSMIYVRLYEAERRAKKEDAAVKSYTVQLDMMRNVEKLNRYVRAADAFAPGYKANMLAAALALTFRKGLAWSKVGYMSYAAWDGEDSEGIEEALLAVQPVAVTPVWNCIAKDKCDMMFAFKDEKHFIHGKLAGLPIEKHVRLG